MFELKNNYDVRSKFDAEMPPEGLTRDEALNVMTNAHALSHDLHQAVQMLESVIGLTRMPPVGLNEVQSEFLYGAITAGIKSLQAYQILKAMKEKKDTDEGGAKAN